MSARRAKRQARSREGGIDGTDQTADALALVGGVHADEDVGVLAVVWVEPVERRVERRAVERRVASVVRRVGAERPGDCRVGRADRRSGQDRRSPGWETQSAWREEEEIGRASCRERV